MGHCPWLLEGILPKSRPIGSKPAWNWVQLTAIRVAMSLDSQFTAMFWRRWVFFPNLNPGDVIKFQIGDNKKPLFRDPQKRSNTDIEWHLSHLVWWIMLMHAAHPPKYPTGIALSSWGSDIAQKWWFSCDTWKFAGWKIQSFLSSRLLEVHFQL